MGIVDLFSKRQAKLRQSQAQPDDDIWERYEQAQQPEQFPLPTGQTISTEDFSDEPTDPWNLYYTYMESVAIPQIEETQTALKHLNQSIPGGMLPEPGDPVDLPKLYPEAIEKLEIIKNYLIEKLPSSGREVDEFFDKKRQKSVQDRDQQALEQIEKEGYPQELEEAKRGPLSRSEIVKFYTSPTRRTVGPSVIDEPIDPTEHGLDSFAKKTVAQLFAERR